MLHAKLMFFLPHRKNIVTLRRYGILPPEESGTMQDSKGNPVRVRNSTRCCKFHNHSP